MNLNKDKYSKNFFPIILLAITLFVPRTFDERDVLQANTYSSLQVDKSLLQNGDLVFRRGISFVSNMVLETDSRSPYSHVGIIVTDSTGQFVIHAVPDESESDIDFIRKDPIDLFLRKDRASAYAVYRFYDSTVAAEAAINSSKYYNQEIIFDGSFDLFDPEKYYCTELIWRAYKEAGISITGNVFDTLTIPLGSNPYLLPGTLLNSDGLTQVTISSIFQ